MKKCNVYPVDKFVFNTAVEEPEQRPGSCSCSHKVKSHNVSIAF